MDINILVGPQSYQDGIKNMISADRQGAIRVAPANGHYAEACRNGNMISYCTPAAGVALVQYSSTTQQCVLFNPPANNKAFFIRRVTVGYVSATMTAGSIVYAVQTTAGNAISSGSASAIVLNNKLTGNVAGQTGTLILYTAVTVVAFTYFRPAAFSNVVMTAAGTNAPWFYQEDIDGSVCLMPGAAFAVAGNISLGTTAAVIIDGVELPVGLVT